MRMRIIIIQIAKRFSQWLQNFPCLSASNVRKADAGSTDQLALLGYPWVKGIPEEPKHFLRPRQYGAVDW